MGRSNYSACALGFRTYERGDESELSAVFNSAYAHYCGFMVRSAEYWTWNCLRRPGMHPEGIIIVEESGTTVGYVAADTAGTVWEFAVGAATDRERVATELLSRAINYVTKMGAGRIILSVPAVDHLLLSACESLEFVDLGKPGLRMHLALLDSMEVLKLLCDARPPSDNQDLNIELQVRKSGSDEVEHIIVCAYDGVSAPTAVVSRLTIRLSNEDLTSIIIGTLRPLHGLLSRRIKVQPIGKTLVVWRFLRSLRLDAPWFVPLGDVL